MLEGYVTAGFLAACTERIKLGLLVSGVHHRPPGLLLKMVTTLDVLSGGRAYLGLGAGWFERESIGLGLGFPPLALRYEQLQETLQLAKQMWADDAQPFNGAHYRLAQPLCRPQPISRPHPPILIGGEGERKTLRLVAAHADACNLWVGRDREFLDGPDLVRRKLEVLRRHCATSGCWPRPRWMLRPGTATTAPINCPGSIASWCSRRSAGAKPSSATSSSAAAVATAWCWPARRTFRWGTMSMRAGRAADT